LRRAALAALVVWARPATAQLSVSGSAGLSLAEHRVDAGYGVEISGGALAGGSAIALLRERLALSVLAQAGRLEPTAGAIPEREMAELGLTAGARIVRGLWATGGVRWRTYDAPIALQRWRFVELGASARVSFAAPGLAALARVTLLPSIAVTGGGDPHATASAAVGVEYSPGRIGAQLLYGRERFEFPAPSPLAARRLEQLSMVMLRGTVRLLGAGAWGPF
jgi:hypothetical protein